MNVMRAAAAGGILAAVMNHGLAADSIRPVMLTGHTQSASVLAWATDGKTVATAGDDRSIRMWDPFTGRQTAYLPEIAREGYGSPVVAFTADLRIAAINSWGEITIRTVADGNVVTKIDPILDRGKDSAFRPDVFAMAFSPDGRRLATAGSVAAVGGRHGSPGGIVIVWDLETGKIVYKSQKLSTAGRAVVWSPDGKTVVAGTSGAGGELQESGAVWVWDAQSGKVLYTFPVKPTTEYGEWASAADLAVSPDGKRVAVPITADTEAAQGDRLEETAGPSVRVWHLETGKETPLLTGPKAAVGRLTFSPDGQRLATAGRDKVVRIWDTEAGKELASLPCPDPISAIAFSPDGKSLMAAGRNGSVRIWALSAAQ